MNEMSDKKKTVGEWTRTEPLGRTIIYRRVPNHRDISPGGFGMVIRAKRTPPDAETDGEFTEVALKLFNDDPDKLALAHEAKGIDAIWKLPKDIQGIARPLASKPFKVTGVAENGQHVESYAIDSRWISCPTLKDWIEKMAHPAPLLMKERLAWGVRVMERLLDKYCALHDNGLVHGDAHIGNLAYDEQSNEVWILDFSLTRWISPEGGNTAVTGGGVLGDSRDPYADEEMPPIQRELYGLGNVAHSLLTGEFQPGRSQEDRRCWLIRKDVPHAIAEWIARMTSRNFWPKTCAEARTLFLAAKANAEAEDQDVQAAVQEWLQNQPIKVGSRNKQGRALMHFAAKEGRIDVLTELKKRGEDINAQDNDGRTPIFLAAITGRVDAITWFKTQGADVNAKDNEGKTPMHHAAGRIASQSMQRLKMLGADVEPKDNNGRTPMFDAARTNQVNAMVWLKTEGADVNIEDKDGRTPLSLVESEHIERPEAIQWLRKYAAD